MPSKSVRPVAVGNPSGTKVLDYTLTSIVTARTCTTSGLNFGTPDNGTFLFVAVEATTTADHVPSPVGVNFLKPGYWATIGPDGLTQAELATTEVYGCAATSGVLGKFAPGSKYQGNGCPGFELFERDPSAAAIGARRLGMELLNNAGLHERGCP